MYSDVDGYYFSRWALTVSEYYFFINKEQGAFVLGKLLSPFLAQGVQ